MAQRYSDEGRDTPKRAAPANGVPDEQEHERRPEEAPPGSRERSESDVSGWSSERDEPPAVRQGRFHRAARMRMAQPRTEEGPPVQRPERPPSPAQGPYGHDDRATSSAAGLGRGRLMGEQDTPHSLEAPHPPRSYRPWNRRGPGAEGHGPERSWREPPPVREHRGHLHPHAPEPPPRAPGEHGGYGLRGASAEEYSALLGMGEASPARPTPEPPARRGRWEHEPLTAREIMTRHVKSVHRDSSLREVARIMESEDCGIVPVVDQRGRLQGVITDRDLVIRSFAEGKEPTRLRAEDVMTEDVEVVTPDEDIHGIIELMGRYQVRRMPVVERDDRLVGIISMADIATRAHYDEELQEALDRISARRSFWSRWF
ncbi:MAG TPA: CBS domain-containing protein [Myxococcaceae bacterium]|nr:CBS domain-containing protein [Myxococcaceae bacterium]